MSSSSKTVNNLKINRGTYSTIQSNLDSIGEDELILVTDKAVPIPTSSDSGKTIIVNSSGEYELGNSSGGGTIGYEEILAYSVAVTFQNGYDTSPSSWESTKIYGNYTYDTSTGRLDISENDLIGQITTADGTTNVFTPATTEKLAIICYGGSNDGVSFDNGGSMTQNVGITTLTWTDYDGTHSPYYKWTQFQTLYLDNTQVYPTLVALVEVLDNGIITFDKVDWAYVW